MLLRPEPSRVFEHMSTDLFEYGGRHFLVIADRKSGWPTTCNLGRQITAQDIIAALREAFCNTAVPTILYSDGGPQFTSKAFRDFMQQWGVRHIVSSPHYPQSNGHAEASVKAMKALVKHCWNERTRNVDVNKWMEGLLQWRNTPRVDGRSPAQIRFGHPSRDTLPVHKRAFAPEWQKAIKQANANTQAFKLESKQCYDKTAHPLQPFNVGANVVVQDHATKQWDKYGTIVHGTIVGDNRDYLI